MKIQINHKNTIGILEFCKPVVHNRRVPRQGSNDGYHETMADVPYRVQVHDDAVDVDVRSHVWITATLHAHGSLLDLSLTRLVHKHTNK